MTQEGLYAVKPRNQTTPILGMNRTIQIEPWPGECYGYDKTRGVKYLTPVTTIHNILIYPDFARVQKWLTER